MNPKILNKAVGRGKIEEIDILKGIGICLVLIAHSAGGFVHTFAYSFHMPLFFIVSGFLWKQRNVKEDFQNNIRRLLVPFWFTELVILLGALLMQGYNNTKIVSPHDAFEMLYYGNCGSANYGKIWGNFASTGSVWFLPALFWAKSYFNGMSHAVSGKRLLIVSLIICVVTVIIGQYLILPYCMIQGLNAIVFVCLGSMVRDVGLESLYDKKWKKAVWIIAIIGWLASTPFDVFDMYQMRWKLGILPNVIFACAGTFVFYLVSKWVCKHAHYVKAFFMLMGKYSLVILCFAPIKYYLLPIEDFVPFDGIMHKLLVVGVKVGWIVVTILLAIYCKPLKWVFKLK